MIADEKVCYTDTPFIPGTNYRVHGVRPVPEKVTPGAFPRDEQPGSPPSDAKVLFDGSGLSAWQSKDGTDASWKVKDGYMEVAPGSGNIKTRNSFGSCQLHIEWAAPEEVKKKSQFRGNSGVFLMEKYEVQVLDSYDNPTYPDGYTGAIYGQCPPLVNASLEPGKWQSYDILWEAPVFDGERLVSPAYLTLLHNGVMVHHHKELMGPTKHKETTCYTPHDPCGSIMLQDHGDLVRYRNIWVRTHMQYDLE